MWFEDLVGFKEESPEQVRGNLILENKHLISTVNGKSFQYGNLEIPTLKELKKSTLPLEIYQDKIALAEVVGKVEAFLKAKENQGAVFQVASQFNLLEMIHPGRIPEQGVGIYERDKTQGPACAIACGAGTIYRNYFVKTGNQTGQTSRLQIDCLDQVGRALKNEDHHLWQMQNGYLCTTGEGLENINEHLINLNRDEFQELKEKLKIGIQWDTEVTISENRPLVSQAFCSALPIAYSTITKPYWRPFAQLILDGTYEATFFAALKNYEKTGNRKLYLTLVGGGAFGNDPEWIFEAIGKSVKKFRNTPLEVKIVSYPYPSPGVKEFIDKMNL